MNFRLQSDLHPPKQKDLSKWSTWYRDVVGFAGDVGIKRIPTMVYKELFKRGLTPREAVQVLASRLV